LFNQIGHGIGIGHRDFEHYDGAWTRSGALGINHTERRQDRDDYYDAIEFHCYDSVKPDRLLLFYFTLPPRFWEVTREHNNSPSISSIVKRHGRSLAPPLG